MNSFSIISRVDNQFLRVLLVVHAIDGNWNSRTLQHNVDSRYLGRMLKIPEDESKEAANFIKDRYLFEFLGLPLGKEQTETKIDSALINHLHQFLMELGKGFAFVARQHHIVTDTSDFYIDLVFIIII